MPKKPQTDIAREKLVAVRFTPTEHAAFVAAAEKDSMTLSAWLRWLAEQRVVAQGKKRK